MSKTVFTKFWTGIAGGVRNRSVSDSKLQSPRHKANLIDQKSLLYLFEYLLISTLVSKGAKEQRRKGVKVLMSF